MNTINFVTFDESGPFQGGKDGGEIYGIVGEYIQLEGARLPDKAPLAIGDGEQPDEGEAKRKAAFEFGIKEDFMPE